MNALLLILHLIPISTPPPIDHNSAMCGATLLTLALAVGVAVPLDIRN